MRSLNALICAFGVTVGCNATDRGAPAGASGADTQKPPSALGIRAQGDTEIQPDLAQAPSELQKVYSDIDEHIFVAEGDEERMDIGLRKFVKDHPELLEGADGMYLFGGQNQSGSAGFSGGSEAACTSS
jgi:hypothetical protein